MTVRVILALCLLAALPPASAFADAGQAPQPPAPLPAPPPTDESPAPPRDPAEVLVTTSSAVMLVPVKAPRVADYEAAITQLQRAFASSTDADTRRVAAGWTVMKANEADGKGNVIYVHVLQPTVSGVDYRPSMWMARLIQDLPLEVLDKYRDALAGPASLLSLSPLAVMSDMPARPVPAPGDATGPPDAGAAVPAATPSPVKRPGGPSD